MLIGLPLAILILLTFLSMLINSGGLTSVGGAFNGFSFGFDPVLGLIGIVIGIVAVASITGIQVLGSGLQEQSVKTITVSILYGSLWAIFSIFSSPFFLSIAIFGALFWCGLTILYVLGIWQKISQ